METIFNKNGLVIKKKKIENNPKYRYEYKFIRNHKLVKTIKTYRGKTHSFIKHRGILFISDVEECSHIVFLDSLEDYTINELYKLN